MVLDCGPSGCLALSDDLSWHFLGDDPRASRRRVDRRLRRCRDHARARPLRGERTRRPHRPFPHPRPGRAAPASASPRFSASAIGSDRDRGRGRKAWATPNPFGDAVQLEGYSGIEVITDHDRLERDGRATDGPSRPSLRGLYGSFLRTAPDWLAVGPGDSIVSSLATFDRCAPARLAEPALLAFTDAAQGLAMTGVITGSPRVPVSED